jgi:hypothetical protein
MPRSDMFRGYHVTVYPITASARTARRVADRVMATLGRPAILQHLSPWPDEPGTHRVDIYVPLRVSSPSRAVFFALASVQAIAPTWIVHGPRRTPEGTLWLLAQIHEPDLAMKGIRRAYLSLESEVPQPRRPSPSAARITGRRPTRKARGA